MEKKKIGILGGSFNPITKGHILVAEYVLESENKFDEIWLLPSYISLYGKKLVSSNHRINMCKLAIENNKKIKICDFEIVNKLKSSTYYTMKLLSEKYPKYLFYFIIGADNANLIESWNNSKELLETVPIAVIPRIGYNFDTNKINNWVKNKKGYKHIFIKGNYGKIIKVSSTEFKQYYLTDYNSNKIIEMIDIKILNYIINNSLYNE